MSLLVPSTGTYQLLNGTAQRDTKGGLMNAVYLRLTTPLGSFWADPKLGSRLHELKREKDVPRVMRLAKQYAEQALAPLTQSKRVHSITVEVIRPLQGKLELYAVITPLQGEVIRFRHFVQVGG